MLACEFHQPHIGVDSQGGLTFDINHIFMNRKLYRQHLSFILPLIELIKKWMERVDIKV